MLHGPVELHEDSILSSKTWQYYSGRSALTLKMDGMYRRFLGEVLSKALKII